MVAIRYHALWRTEFELPYFNDQMAPRTGLEPVTR